MSLIPSPPRIPLRLMVLLSLLVAAAVGVVSAPKVDARQQWLRGQIVSRGAKPFTESVAQMRRRDLARRAQNLGANLSPAPWANPSHPKPAKKALELDPSSPSIQGYFFPSSAPTTQSVGTSFAGVGMQDQISQFFGWSYPPDTMGAVGPNHFVQVINGSVAIYNKTTGARVSHIRLDSFFTFSSNGVNYPRNGSFDPRVVYDRNSGRWFVCALEFGSATPSGFTAANHLLLAVSRNSDPTGTFDKYALTVGEPTVGSTAGFTDYPTLGVDSNGVYAAVRIFTFDPNTGIFGSSFAKLVATPLASLISASPSLGTVTVLSNVTDMYSTPQPAMNLDSVGGSSPAWFFATSPSSSNLRYRKVTWSGGIPSFSSTGDLITPSAGLNLPNNGTVPALDSSTFINAGDVRLQSATIRNNRLWTARNVAVNSSGTSSSANRVACEWFEINVSNATPTLTQNGRVFDTAANDPRHYYYPAIMVNGQGHAVMGFSGSKSTEYVGAYYAGRLATDTAGTMGEATLLKAGTGGYTQNDPGGRNRWGDYSHTTLDPNDNMSLWTVQEYAESTGQAVGNPPTSSRWGTRIAKLLAPAPALNSPGTREVSPGETGVTIDLAGTGFYDPGSGFPNRLAVAFSGPAGDITNITTSNISSTGLRVTFNVAADASAGMRTLTLTNPDGQSASATDAVNVVVGASSVVDLSSASYTVSEDAGTATITVNRTGVTSGTTAVTYDTSNGTAQAGSDYSTTTGTLTFTAGETSKTFDVPITADNLLEGEETLNLTLSSPTGGILGATPSAVMTIADDTSTPGPSGLSATPLSQASVALSWTDNSGNESGFEVDRKVQDGGYVTLSTQGANATSALDSGPFVPGTVYTYRVRAVRDTNSSDYSNEASAALTVLEFSAAAASAAEGSGTAQLTVTRSGDTTGSASATVTVTGGTATAPEDYTTPSTTVSFSAGQTSRTVSVPVQADALLEGDETVTLSLSAPTGAGVVLGAQASATLTITDDVDVIAPSGLSASVHSGSEISLSWVDNCDNEAGYEIERKAGDGAFIVITPTAAANATSFIDGGRSRGVVYTYRVRAIRPGLASSYSNTSSAAIDGVQFSTEAYSGAETDGAVTLIVSRTGSGSGAVSVDYVVASGTATDGMDFTAVSGTLSFADGDTTPKMIVVPVADDANIEGDETFTVTLSNAVGIGLGTPSTATVTITDNRAAARPTNLQATILGASLIRLDWQDNSANETGFRVERELDGTGFVTIGTAGPGVSTFDDALAPQDVSVTYRVKALGSGSESEASNEATVVIPSKGKLAVSPKKLNFGKVKVGKVKRKKLKLKNTGKAVLFGEVGTIDPRLTILSGGGPFELAPRKGLTVQVEYAPTVPDTVIDTLVITSTDTRKPSTSVNIKARAK